MLSDASREEVAPVIAVLGLAAAVVGWLIAGNRGRGRTRIALAAIAWTMAAGLGFVIPDFRLLVLVAYAPIILVTAPFGWLPEIRLADAMPWPVVNQLICAAGGILWAGAATVYQRRGRDACSRCGRPEPAAGLFRPETATRWGRWATVVAVIIPVIYALTRWAWAAGIPLGITEAFFREGEAIDLWDRGAALGILAVIGAALTPGLIRPWGEEFPSWLPFLGGRTVPRLLVIVPAALLAVIITAAGVMFVRVAIRGDFMLGVHRITLNENFAALAPELLWPVWGVALGIAALGYHYRVRPPCRACGRG